MPEKNVAVLSDKNVVPSDDLIFSLIGDKKLIWVAVMDKIKLTFEDSAGEWNYYNDGKSWLFKMVRKKKTLFWIGLTENTFRVTFWFSDKAESLINESKLPEKIKKEFSTAKKYGAIRGVSIVIDDINDSDNVLILAGIKNKFL